MPQVRRWIVIGSCESWIVGIKSEVSESKAFIVVRVPYPEVPILRGLIDITVGLRVEKLALVKVHGESLGFTALRCSQVFVVAKLLGEFLPAISSVPVFPFNQ